MFLLGVMSQISALGEVPFAMTAFVWMGNLLGLLSSSRTQLTHALLLTKGFVAPLTRKVPCNMHFAMFIKFGCSKVTFTTNIADTFCPQLCGCAYAP